MLVYGGHTKESSGEGRVRHRIMQVDGAAFLYMAATKVHSVEYLEVLYQPVSTSSLSRLLRSKHDLCRLRQDAGIQCHEATAGLAVL
jgi:hypothetical protein